MTASSAPSRLLSAFMKPPQAALVAAILLMNSHSLNAKEPAAPVLPSSPATYEPALQRPSTIDDTLLADEIIRRLRRLGLNFTRFRLSRPYDPAWDLC